MDGGVGTKFDILYAARAKGLIAVSIHHDGLTVKQLADNLWIWNHTRVKPDLT